LKRRLVNYDLSDVRWSCGPAPAGLRMTTGKLL
jgi:hypothetical protein